MAIIIKTKKPIQWPTPCEYDRINYHILVRPVGTPSLNKFIALIAQVIIEDFSYMGISSTYIIIGVIN